MKGILICGGTGSRLKPLTEVTNKSLLPIYDKPLILYPLQVLLDAGIRQIMVISGSEHVDQMARFLGSGDRFGCEFSFRVQDKPQGIAQALGLAQEFAAGDSLCAMLGDNIFFDDLSPVIRSFESGGHLFVKEVADPSHFGVVELGEETSNEKRKVLSIEEKPKKPKSNLIATGCYLYDNHCFKHIRTLKPSARGELEITDVSDSYIRSGMLSATILKDEWIDAGTFERLYAAATLVRARRAS